MDPGRAAPGPAAERLTGVRPRDRALAAWRYWQVTPDGMLRSVAHTRFRWPAGAPLEAVCTTGGHAAPRRGCGCGIYGAADLDTLCARGLCCSPDPLVVGEVALWGRMISDGAEHRAARAYPQRLLVVPETAREMPLEALSASLRAYGVPVGSMPLERAAGELTARLIATQAMSARAR